MAMMSLRRPPKAIFVTSEKCSIKIKQTMSRAMIKDRKKEDVSERYCNPQFYLWLGFVIHIVHETILHCMAWVLFL